MAAAYDFGNLLTTQGSRNYRMPSQGANAAAAALGNTQNWAGLAAATSASAAQRDAAWTRAFADTASQGLSSYGQLASSVVNAYGGIGQQGISAAASERAAELAIEREKAARGGSRWGNLLGAGVSLAGAALLWPRGDQA